MSTFQLSKLQVLPCFHLRKLVHIVYLPLQNIERGVKLNRKIIQVMILRFSCVRSEISSARIWSSCAYHSWKRWLVVGWGHSLGLLNSARREGCSLQFIRFAWQTTLGEPLTTHGLILPCYLDTWFQSLLREINVLVLRNKFWLRCFKRTNLFLQMILPLENWGLLYRLKPLAERPLILTLVIHELLCSLNRALVNPCRHIGVLVHFGLAWARQPSHRYFSDQRGSQLHVVFVICLTGGKFAFFRFLSLLRLNYFHILLGFIPPNITALA